MDLSRPVEAGDGDEGLAVGAKAASQMRPFIAGYLRMRLALSPMTRFVSRFVR